MSHQNSIVQNIAALWKRLDQDCCAPMTTSHTPSKLSSYCSWMLRKSAWFVIVGWWGESSGKQERLEEKGRQEQGKVIEMEEKERRFMWCLYFLNLSSVYVWEKYKSDVVLHWIMLHWKWKELWLVFSALEKREVKVWFHMAHTGRHLENPQRAGSYSRRGRRRRWGNQERVVAQKEWSTAGCWILSKFFFLL